MNNDVENIKVQIRKLNEQVSNLQFHVISLLKSVELIKSVLRKGLSYKFDFNLPKIGDYFYVNLKDTTYKDLRSLHSAILSSLRLQKLAEMVIGDYTTCKENVNNIERVKITKIL